jgi:hypothetical protein
MIAMEHSEEPNQAAAPDASVLCTNGPGSARAGESRRYAARRRRLYPN